MGTGVGIILVLEVLSWSFCLEVLFWVQTTPLYNLLQSWHFLKFNQITFLEPAATIKAHDCVQFWCSRLWSFTLNTTLKECCEVYIKCRLKYCLHFGGKPAFGGIWVLRNYRFSLKCCTEGTTGHIRTNIYLIKVLRQQIKQQTDSYQYKNIRCSHKTNNLLWTVL